MDTIGHSAEWEPVYEYDDFLYAICSACGEENDFMTRYCPNCGAKMKS